MGNLVIWIVIFAGVTLGLLATFLIASERELRAELDNIAKNGDDTTTKTSWVSSDAIADHLPAAMEESKFESTGHPEPAAQSAELETTPASTDTEDTELATIRRGIAEQTRINTELKADNLRLRDEIFELRSRLARSRGNQASGDIFSSEPGAQHAALLARESGASESYAKNDAAPRAPTDAAVSALMKAPIDPIPGSGDVPLIPLMPPVTGAIASERKPSSKRGTLFALAIFVLALGMLATQAWRLDLPQKDKPQTFSEQSMPDARQLSGEKKTTTAKMATLRHAGERRQVRVSSSQAPRKNSTTAKIKSAQTSAASYEIVYPAEVFSEPNESSHSVAQVETGMDVYVVNAQNGWLEIRSKHGRPPGFIKTENAVRMRAH